MTAATTTVKVSPGVRDRLNEIAAAQGLSAGSIIEKLLEAYLWSQQVELAKKQMREAPLEVWEGYLTEFASLDGSIADGLEDLPWEP